MPTAGIDSFPVLLLGWGPAVLWGVGVGWVVVPCELDDPVAGVVEVLDDAEAEADVLWLAEVLVLLATEVEDPDPPHADSSSTSDPSPAAAHPLLRIFLSLEDDPIPGRSAIRDSATRDVTR